MGDITPLVTCYQGIVETFRALKLFYLFVQIAYAIVMIGIIVNTCIIVFIQLINIMSSGEDIKILSIDCKMYIL